MDENAKNLRLFDNDKYIAAMFAPADKRKAVLALFNFHYEISMVPLEVSEPMVGLIKFQWWRDCFEEIRQGKPPRPHPILLGLKGTNVNYNQLELVINTYDKLLEGEQPRTFDELDNFIIHTQVIIFEQLANILETTCPETMAKSYSYTFLARKLLKNAATYGKFAANPENMAKQLLAKSADTVTGANTVFDIITRYYNKKLAKNAAKPEAGRWKLLLKLAFSRADII